MLTALKRLFVLFVFLPIMTTLWWFLGFRKIMSDVPTHHGDEKQQQGIVP